MAVDAAAPEDRAAADAVAAAPEDRAAEADDTTAPEVDAVDAAVSRRRLVLLRGGGSATVSSSSSSAAAAVPPLPPAPARGCAPRSRLRAVPSRPGPVMMKDTTEFPGVGRLGFSLTSRGSLWASQYGGGK